MNYYCSAGHLAPNTSWYLTGYSTKVSGPPPPSFVIPIARETGTGEDTPDSSADSDRTDVYTQLETLNDLRERGILTDAKFDAEKKKLLEGEQE